MRRFRNKRLVIIGIITLGLITLIVLLLSRGATNTTTGGTGGDYTPEGWVVLSQIPELAGVTNEQYSDITSQLSEDLQKNHNEPEYSAVYLDASLEKTSERYVYISTKFIVTVLQTDEKYQIEIYSNLVEGTTKTTVSKINP